MYVNTVILNDLAGVMVAFVIVVFFIPIDAPIGSFGKELSYSLVHTYLNCDCVTILSLSN